MLTVVLTIGSTVGSTAGSTVGSMVSLTVGFKVSSMVGSTFGSTWLCWVIDLSKAFNSSDERLNELIVLQTRFTGFVKQTCHFTGFNGYCNSDKTHRE
jgi:hypothetical protein